MRQAVVLLVLIAAVSGCARAATDQTERSATGAIIEAGSLGTEHLMVGDCIRDPVPAAVDALVGVPCARSHAAQVYALVDDQAGCFDAVETVVAPLVGRDDLPQVDVSALVAEDGGRVVCLLEFATPVAEDLVRLAG